nr:UDP-forming cellulose synthase catalytic subunit [Methylobacterium dankookense]
MALLWLAWGLAAAAALAFLTQPVGPEAQAALCGGAVAGMLALWLACPRRGLPRAAFLALGSFVAIRYVYWRLTATLPAIDDPLSFGLGLVLLAAELYCVLILAVSLVVNAEPLERGPVPVPDPAEAPSVDILVPSYNEGADILGVTLAAACNLDYPADRFTVWLLDDGGTDQKCADPDPEKAAAARARRAELQALCAGLGARYLTRARNAHAKAGNLNAGLRAGSGDLVLVLDADHAPFRSFLKETVGLFGQDPKLFLVQTPHIFHNPDPLERNLRTFERMPSENEMFYAATQAGLDKWNGSFFCGSAALLRRSALDTVGGFAGITITEDCETALELHARGWASAFVDRPLISGLQPETFSAFVGQRARWCQGMLQILLLKNPLFKRGLKPIQRLAYLSSMLFWFFPLSRLVFMLAPLLHIFFDVKIFVSSIDETLAYTATYVGVNMLMQSYLYGHLRWPWVSELYEYVLGIFLARSIVSVVVSPRKPGFNVTDKGVSLESDHLSALAWPFFLVFGLLAAGCATAAWRYLCEPGVTGLMLVVGLWCAFNLVIAGAALGVVAERRTLERAPSLPTALPARLGLGGASLPVRVERASIAECVLRRADGGAWPKVAFEGAIEGEAALLGPDPAGPAFPPLRLTLGPVLADGTRRAAYAETGPEAFRTVARLMYGDAGPLRAFLAGRRRHRGLLSGSLGVLAWGLAEPVRAAAYALRALRSPAPAAAPEAIPVEAPIQAQASVAAAPALALAASAPVPEPLPAAEPVAIRVQAEPAIPALRPLALAPALAAAPAPAEPEPVRFDAAAWAEAVAQLAALAESRTGSRAAPEAGPLDPALWARSVRALAEAEAAPVRAPVADGAPARSPRDPLRDAA